MGEFEVNNFKELSNRNLKIKLDEIKKYKIINNELEVKTAIDSAILFHCVKESNIINLINDRELRTKNILSNVEVTGINHDFIQGFDKNISFSIGIPWVSYGNLCVAVGLDKVDERTLFFYEDPWQFDADKLTKNFLIKEDFIILCRELLLRNLYMKSDSYWRIRRKISLHKLIVKNFNKFEIKVFHNIPLEFAENIFVLSNVERFMIGCVNIFYNPLLLMIGILIAGLFFILYGVNII